MKKIILILVAVLVALGLVGYFAVMPGVLASKFETANKSAYEDAQKAVEKTRDNFSSMSIYKNDSDASTADEVKDQLKDVDESQDDVEDAQKKVEDGQTALKKVNPSKWPLISNIGKLKSAKEKAEKLDEYYSKSEKYLKEFKAVNVYVKETGEVGLDMLTALEEMGTATDETALIASLEKSVKEIEGALEKIKDIDAPEGLKDYKENVESELEKMAEAMKDLTTAVKNQDETALQAASVKIEEVTNSDKTKKLWNDFRKKSNFIELKDKTEELEGEISF